jgi:hypothetical protein
MHAALAVPLEFRFSHGLASAFLQGHYAYKARKSHADMAIINADANVMRMSFLCSFLCLMLRVGPASIAGVQSSQGLCRTIRKRRNSIGHVSAELSPGIPSSWTNMNSDSTFWHTSMLLFLLYPPE